MRWIFGGFIVLVLVAVFGGLLAGWTCAVGVLAGALITAYCITKFEIDVVEEGF